MHGDVVLEEFLWRVEMLKAGRVVPYDTAGNRST